jgi:hypothetical protein
MGPWLEIDPLVRTTASPGWLREELNMGMAGLSKSCLARMHQVLSGYIERKEMPGLIALISHHDDIHVETLGTMSFTHPAPMRRDSIFRIASLTELITARCGNDSGGGVQVTARWIDRDVAAGTCKSPCAEVLSSQRDDTVPARRAITLRDLPTFRMGFGSAMAGQWCFGPAPKLTNGYSPNPASKQEEQSDYDHKIELAKPAIKPNPQLSVA